jgi:hypothetical protein
MPDGAPHNETITGSAKLEGPHSTTEGHPMSTPGIPHQLHDRHGRLWAWDGTLGAYRHDTPTETLVKTLTDLTADCGPLTPPPAGTPDDPQEILDRIQALKPTPGTNAFEWAWEHSGARGLAHVVLMLLAWRHDNEPTEGQRWFGHHHLSETLGYSISEVADAVTELIALGELELHGITDTCDLVLECPNVTYTFPAYREWWTHMTSDGHRNAAAELRAAAVQLRGLLDRDLRITLETVSDVIGPLAAWLEQAADDAELIGVDHQAIALARVVNK